MEEWSQLRKQDIGQVVRLSTQAGWNQTREDWVRLLELNPGTCFLYRKEGRVVGSGTLAVYGGHTAWIGMVIVDKSFRGKGIGRRILERLIEEGQKRNCRVIGLDATSQGRQLYKKYGFYDVALIDRWSGSLQGTEPEFSSVKILENGDLQEVAALDAECTGVDRSSLIQSFLKGKKVTGLGIRQKKDLKGYLFVRPGRENVHLGPVVAQTEKDTRILLSAATHKNRGKQFLADVIRRDSMTVLMKGYGLQIQRELTRMTLGKPLETLQTPCVRAIVSFEWG